MHDVGGCVHILTKVAIFCHRTPQWIPFMRLHDEDDILDS